VRWSRLSRQSETLSSSSKQSGSWIELEMEFSPRQRSLPGRGGELIQQVIDLMKLVKYKI
jgi:hypothetical protein